MFEEAIKHEIHFTKVLSEIIIKFEILKGTSLKRLTNRFM